MAEATEEFASLADAEKATGELPDEDWLRLEQVARYYVYRYAAIDPKEILGEAVARVLVGDRRWPRDVPFLTFLRNVLRSIADEFREKEKVKINVAEPEALTGTSEVDGLSNCNALVAASPAQQLEDQQILKQVWELFADDEKVQALILGAEEGLTAAEVQRDFDLTPNEYDAARKRLERKLRKHFPQGRQG